MSSDPGDSLPISLIRQFLFCPRIPWLRQNIDREYRQPLWVEQGKEYQQRREALLTKRPLFRATPGTGYSQRFDVAVQNQKLGIHGRVDLVIETKTERIPVEIKMHTGRPTRAHMLQLLAYGLCLESREYAVDRGIIITGPRQRRHEIRFTPALRADFQKTLERLRATVVHPFLPGSSASLAKCAQCEHQNQCQDRDI